MQCDGQPEANHQLVQKGNRKEGRKDGRKVTSNGRKSNRGLGNRSGRNEEYFDRKRVRLYSQINHFIYDNLI